MRDRTARSAAILVYAALALLLASCGDDPAPKPTVPVWAKVAPEQIAEAEKHGVPVAFENDLGMRFVLIPAGTFLMGSPEDEENRSEDEGPQHQVTISKPYYMSVYEVTNRQYRAFNTNHDSGVGVSTQPRAQGALATMDHGDTLHTLNGDEQPVADLTLSECKDFAGWLSAGDAVRSYRLPTEAEWERACRAGTTTRFHWGDDAAEAWRYANGVRPAEMDAPAPWGNTQVVAARVGSYRPNAWSLYDMAGNVWERCLDGYARYGDESLIDPRWPMNCPGCVIRGGSWGMQPGPFRSANRFGWPPDLRGESGGFRLVAEVPEPGEGGR